MSNRRLAHTYTLHTEFDGEGVLTADPYPLYPRAFLWAHLDDEIMESVTTNWGNEGIYMEGVGPSLVGRAISGLGPLQQIYLGGALYFDGNGNLSYDPTALQAEIVLLQGQVTALQAQVQADETNYNSQIAALTIRAAADETAITSLQATVFSLQNQIYQILQSALFKPTANAMLAGSGLLTSSLRMPTLLVPPAMHGSGNLGAAVGFQLPTAVSAFSATGNIQAVLGMTRSIGTAMGGAGVSNVDLTQIFSSLKPLGPALLAGTGGVALSKLAEQLAALSALAGAGAIGISLPVALRGLSTLAGVGTSLAGLIQTQLYSATLVGGSNLLADLAQRSYYLTAGLIGGSSLNVNLSDSFTMAVAGMSATGALAPPQLIWRAAGQGALIGTGGLAVTDLQKLLGSVLLAGAGGSLIKLNQVLRGSNAMAGAGALNVSGSGFTVLSSYSAWDPANSDAANLTFSNNNRTLQNSANTRSSSARGTKANNSGKKYFEVTLVVTDNGWFGDEVGLVNASFNTWATVLYATPNGVAAITTSQIIFNNTAITTTSPALNSGDVIGIAVDWVSSPGNAKVSWSFNGLWQNGGGPSTTLTTADFTWTGATTLYPATTVSGTTVNNSNHVLNVGNAAFVYSLPSGYSAWT